MVVSFCLIVLLFVATVTDIKEHKIYNWTTYTGILVAIFLSLLATYLRNFELISIHVAESLKGFAICAGIMIGCFVLFKVGGGDVKLLAMCGAFLGPQLGVIAILWTFVIGAAMGLTILVWKNLGWSSNILTKHLLKWVIEWLKSV